ncbi:MAG: PspC domain-containing protein [Flavobacteriales bacterium]|nr:PspC domain-containing protein [Flavobacteriales bacterium]
MKKTVQVNLSGQVFTLDDDAYDLLSGYLKRIGGLYERSAGKDEILSDIELRIAELLLERKGDENAVVSIADVEAVTEIMGNPEDFEDDEIDVDEPSYSSRSYTGPKRLFRDPDSPLIGGVCSGIGYYFGIDPLWIRLAFAIALIFFGTGILFYVILWIIIPVAKTSADKLSMRGEPVNIDSIGKTVEEELNNLGDRFSEGGKRFTDGNGRKIERGINRFFSFLSEIFRGFFTVLGKVLGGLFILIGVFTIVVLLTGIIGVADLVHLNSHGWDSSYSVYEIGDLVFNSGEWFFMAMVGFFLMIGIPFLALAYGGIVLLFPKVRVPYLGASFAGLWFIGVILSIITGFSVAREFSKEETLTEVVPLDEFGLASDTLLLDVGDDPFKISESRAYYAHNDFMMRVEEGNIMVGNVSFDIRASKNDEASVEMNRSAMAESYEQATMRADAIKYSFQVDSNEISFAPFFTYPEAQLLRGQDVELVLRLPVGKTVYLSKGMKRIIDDIDNVQNMYDPKMVDHYWQMTDEGLNCLDCEESKSTSKMKFEGVSEDGEVKVDINISEN